MTASGEFKIEEVHDLEAVWPELTALFLQFEDYNSGFLTRRLRRDWQQRWYDSLTLHDDRLILIARSEGGDAAGFLNARVRRDYGLFEEVSAHISDVYVTAQHRSQGLGRRLLRRAEDWCISRGATVVSLDAFSANKPAVRFWTLSGFGLDSMSMTKKLRGDA